MKSNQNYIIEELKEIEEWLTKAGNKEFLYTGQIEKIRSLLSEAITSNNCLYPAFRLGSLNFWWANQFLYDIYYNSPTIINSGSIFFDTLFFHLRILIAAADTPSIGARVSAIDVQKLFFLLLTFNRHEQALWLGGRAYLGDTPERLTGRKNEVWTLREVSEWESLGGDVTGWGSIVAKLRRLIPGQKEKECSAGKLPDDPMFPYWEEKPLCGYMLRLWLVMSGQITPEEAPTGHPQCGVYEGLFQHWHEPVALERSIIDALDYHVQRSSEDGDGDYDIPEFTLRPYNVIPFEILAYRNVRTRMGLETPWPSHPLLDSPFVQNLPEELPASDDPLLNEVLAAVRKVLPAV